MSSAINTLSHFDFTSLCHSLEASVEDFTWPRLDLLDSFQPQSPDETLASGPDGADDPRRASFSGHDNDLAEGGISARSPRYSLAPPSNGPATSDSNPTQPADRATLDTSAATSPTAAGETIAETASDGKAAPTLIRYVHLNAVSKESTPTSPEEKRALEQEQRQRELLRVDEIYTRMRAERELHEAKLQAILANLETEVQRIWTEVILRRQKIHSDLLEKWEKVMFG